MRIAQFSDSFLPIVDGVGRVVYNYANYIADKGHECYVIAPMTNTGYRGGYKFELVDYRSIRLKKRQYKVGVPFVDPHFQARMNDIELDIVHAHSPFTAGQAAYNCAKKRGIPLVGTFHSKYKDDFREVTGFNMIAEAGTKYVVDFYEKCDEVWAVSFSSAEILRSYGFKGNIVVMQNGAEEQIIDPADKDMAAAKYALGNEPVFLFVGQQDWKKNIDRILLAAAELNKRNLMFKLVLTGMGPHSREIMKRASSLGLDDRMVYTGHISDRAMLAGLYQCADLFVFPSLYDTAGLVVREAASFGTASVVVRGSCAAEPIIDGVNGFLCEDDTSDLARIMEKAITETEKMKVVGEAARKTIPVSWDVIIDEVLGRYAELVHRCSNCGKERKVLESELINKQKL
ncbi:MAG: glycosyltransferase family 4 protein, partial [Clostridiales bacterium]|nr:glycosyltransferase family 4 protein [Clostridiales bacterium]